MLEPVSDFESRILEVAQLRGILSVSDLECSLEDIAEMGSLSWGPRITALIHKGRLDHATVQALALELMQSPIFTKTTRYGEDSDTEAPQESSLNWSGYSDLHPIAMGGGGMVYRAMDPRLDRWVALKFPRNDQPHRLRWMLREARAQAKVDHPHVAKVHEVGEHEGQPFIAMQLVQSGTLRDVYKQLRLEQKVILMMQVAEGLHAAHQKGLLHQDIKPANILVEFKEDGTPWPFITDFGLVRQETQDGGPSSYGSPPYSSPEQMAGHQERLDRRSDVFSLGATLYYALVGVPPFDTTDPNVLANAAPIPLRARDSQMPADLEAIADKCLRRDRSERYASAWAVAEELRRFLDGKPVEACHPTVLYRATKFFHRHKPQVIVGLVATLLLLGLGFVSLWSAKRSAFRHQLAIRYDQEIRTVENTLRLAHLSRMHDRRESVKEVRQAMERIRQDMAPLGREAVGPGSYALGQGHFILGEMEDAQQQLDRAWAANFRTPACALVRAQVLIELLNRKKTQISTSDPDVRKELQHKLEQKYGNPAQECLHAARQGGQFAPYSEALEAYLKGNHAQAIQKADEAVKHKPWLYEAYRLQSTIAWGLANEARYEGKIDEARQHFETAICYIDRAINQAPSDPGNWVLQGDLIMGFGSIPGPTREPDYPLLRKAITLFETANRIDLDLSAPYRGLSEVFTLLENDEIQHGRDPMNVLNQAVQYGEMERQRTTPSQSCISLYKALIQRGNYQRSRGLSENTRQDIDQAVVGLRKAFKPEEPNYHIVMALMDAAHSQADEAMTLGEEDQIAYLRETVRWCKELTKLAPREPEAIYSCLVLRSNLLITEDNKGQPYSEPLGDFLKDIEAAEQYPALSTYLPNLISANGRILCLRAQETRRNGGNPAQDYENSRKMIEEGIALSPKDPSLDRCLIRWCYSFAEWQLENNNNPEPILRKAIATSEIMTIKAQGDIFFQYQNPGLRLILANIQKNENERKKAQSELDKIAVNYPVIKRLAYQWVENFSKSIRRRID